MRPSPARSARAGAVALALMLLASLTVGRGSPARAEGGPPVGGEAKVHLDRGLRLYDAKQFAAAAAEFETTYGLDPHRDVLYVWAQALRLAGRCPSAIGLYQRFLEAAPPKREGDRARANLARCREEGASPVVGPPAPATPAAAASPPSDFPPSGDSALSSADLSAIRPLPRAGDGGAPVTVVPDAHLAATPPPVVRPLRRLDGVEYALLGGGVLSAAASGGFYLAARSERDSGRQALTYAEVEQHASAARSRDRLAWGSLAVGATALIAGVARYLWR
jgi:tetratricopeptide (TPR) repeat protein